MFPRSHRKKQKVETKADEDRMAPRLQLDLGWTFLQLWSGVGLRLKLILLERASMSRKPTKGDAQMGVVWPAVQPVASDVTALPLPPSSPLVMVTMTNNVNTIQEVSAISPSYAVAHSIVLQERLIQLTQEME